MEKLDEKLRFVFLCYRKLLLKGEKRWRNRLLVCCNTTSQEWIHFKKLHPSLSIPNYIIPLHARLFSWAKTLISLIRHFENHSLNIQPKVALANSRYQLSPHEFISTSRKLGNIQWCKWSLWHYTRCVCRCDQKKNTDTRLNLRANIHFCPWVS